MTDWAIWAIFERIAHKSLKNRSIIASDFWAICKVHIASDFSKSLAILSDLGAKSLESLAIFERFM